MSHRYSLRPHAKGRRGHQTADEPEGQVKGTTGQSTGVESRPTTPYPHRAAHNSPMPTQDSEEDWQRMIRYRVLGQAETSEEIDAARKRVEARRIAEASRIRREQIVRGYEEDLRMLRARIKALRHECEDRVERVQRKWERDWAIDRGEVVVVVGKDVETRGEEEEEEDKTTRTDQEDEGDMVVDEDYAPTETSLSLTTDDDEDCQWQWPSRSVQFTSSSPETDFPSSIQSSSLSLQSQQPPHMGMFPLSDKEVGPSRRPEQPNERGHIRSSSSQLHPSQPQPLRRQPAQLMVVPTTSSHGL
jgi:hypothetical protein